MFDIERVHVIFKTHLDIGFTDLAANVIRQYMDQYIPAAINLAEQLDLEQGQAGFVWTTGSWLIHEYLRQAGEQERLRMEDAIRKGYIAWHGLPFTTHTELMDPALFEYGLSLAKRLDLMFGRTTVAAKMTDVPGHTRAIVPLLAKHKIAYLHLGVNPASKVPSVPPLFVWKGQDGSEVIVNYASNYGNTLYLEGLKDVMVFAHTGDNCGPPTAEEIKQEFARLSAEYPSAVIQASTMDAFARQVASFKESLPVVYEEIGDTWIHGVAADPLKVAQYRTLLRLRNAWLKEGDWDTESEEYELFSGNLMLIAEHTWGMDEKKYLSDYVHYAKEDFRQARAANTVDRQALHPKYAYLGAFRMNTSDQMSEALYGAASKQAAYALFESSWQEQREYIHKAVAALSPAKQAEVDAAFAALSPNDAIPAMVQSLQCGNAYALGRFTVTFAADGSIIGLTDSNGKDWADAEHRIGGLNYETFGTENYHVWFEQYMENLQHTYSWADADFSKPGMEYAKPKPAHLRFAPMLQRLSVLHGEEADLVYAELSMHPDAAKLYGAPRRLMLEYAFYHREEVVSVTLKWFEKEANRLPEATWLSFALKVDNPNSWQMEKLGELISPLEVVKDGNRNLHAVGRGVFYQGADGNAFVETLDAPLVSPGAARLLRFDQTFAPLDGGMHFLLHNNVWGTNFPMWYGDDAKFTFILHLQSNRR